MTDKENIKKYLVDKLSEVLHLHTENAIVCRKVYQEAITFVDSIDEEPVSEQKLSNVGRIGKNWKEPVSEIDFEQELYKAFGYVKDFTLGMRIASRFYEMGRNHQEPVSEDLELTWEDIKTIYLLVQVEWKPKKTDEEIYKEVLKRFKEMKEK